MKVVIRVSLYLTILFVFLLLRGPMRKPPEAVIEQLKTLNQSLRIGQMLCRSRNPDFLLDIIQRQVGFSFFLVVFI